MSRGTSRRRWLWVLPAVALLLAAALAFIGNYFFDYALNPSSKVTFMDQSPVPTGPWLSEHAQDVWMESEDGLNLHALYAPVENAHRYVIICHGYGNQSASMERYARQFYDMGYSVLMPDARASGRSEGQYMGMGWPERRDVVKWAGTLVEGDPQAQIALYGVSMGGATVMMASGEADLPANVKCVVEDCGYSSVWAEFAWQLRDLYNLPPFPVLYAASLVSGVRAGYFFGEASAVEQVKKSVTPTLFIHGDQDTFVPYSMLDEVYEAAACPKEKLVVAGAGHSEASTVAPELYWSTIEDFLASYLP